MKKILTLLFVLASAAGMAQVTDAITIVNATDGSAEWLPCQPVKVLIDITKGDCDRLVGDPGPLYLWTWMPAGPSIDGGNGAWDSSNEAMKLTSEGNNIWSYTYTPTEFYNVTADEVYANGFNMLVKKKSGVGVGGGCDEDKTSDYRLEVAPPFKSEKVFLLPQAGTQKDFINFYYDKTLEAETSMQNLSAYFIEATCTLSNGSIVTRPGIVQLKERANGKFSYTFIPEKFFPVNGGDIIVDITIVVRKQTVVTDDDRINENALFEIGCEAAKGGC
jgi:hypothetical protein